MRASRNPRVSHPIHSHFMGSWEMPGPRWKVRPLIPRARSECKVCLARITSRRAVALSADQRRGDIYLRETQRLTLAIYIYLESEFIITTEYGTRNDSWLRST